MMKKHLIILSLMAISIWCIQTGLAAEPNIADYTSMPLTITETVEPNIMIMLDNSGSMNCNAYGECERRGGTVTLEPFNCGTADVMVATGTDDAEEYRTSGVTNDNHSELDLGGEDATSANQERIIGVRFDNVPLLRNAVITSAYIEFEANTTTSTNATYTITGEAGDSPPTFANTDYNVSSRPRTAASVTWDTSALTWTVGNKYQTADLTSIVQEIVNRSGWDEGHAMVFILERSSATGRNPAKPYEASGDTQPVLHVEYSSECHQYYGYFDPGSKYTYNGTKYVPDAAGNWDGNFLNWLTMRRVDILRKVLVGGLATSRTGGGNTTNKGHDTGNSFVKWYDGDDVSPYHGNYKYRIKDGDIDVYNSSNNFQASYHIWVYKDETSEPQNFKDGNIVGILQKVGDKAKWGNAWFNYGTGKNGSGAKIAHPVGTNMNTMVTDMENTAPGTWTPLAEALYVIMQYYKQQSPESGLDYPNNAIGSTNCNNDPFCDNTSGDKIACAKNFVLMLTDGLSTKDAMIPGFLKDTDGDGDRLNCTDYDCQYNIDGTGGSDYLDDVALYMRTHDLRADVDDTQNVYLYMVYAFGTSDVARKLLKDAARNGGFDDMNSNNLPDGDYSDPPDQRKEWDNDGDDVPDTYFEASDGYKLETELLNAITAMLKRAASGTSASVLSTTSEGEGTVVQAYFFPEKIDGLDKVNWMGYLQSLWIDTEGHIREDTQDAGGNHDYKLDEATDNIITFVTDENQTKIKRTNVTTHTDTIVPLDQLEPIWEAGENLAKRTYPRKIYTTVNGTDLIEFSLANKDVLKPYLGVRDGATWGYLGASQDERVENLIKFVLGQDITGARNRTLAGVTWTLGDIVHSSPATISHKAIEGWDATYADDTYREFVNSPDISSRDTMVYAGGNDGMLHAITSWKYNDATHAFEKPAVVADADEKPGDEIWAFIPRSLLPHLRFLADPNYTHVYYVDEEPKITDVKIFTPSSLHKNGWGTILMCGLGFGGKSIWVTSEDFGSGPENRTFDPSYFCLDITDPRNPTLLWEKTYSGSGFTNCKAVIPKVNDKWFAVLTSGPTDYDGSSNQTGAAIIIDPLTGTEKARFPVSEGKSLLTWPTALDYSINYNADAIYFGTMYESGSSYKGKVYKIQIPVVSPGYDDLCESTNSSACPTPVYNDVPSTWLKSEMYSGTKPIQAPLTVAMDDEYAVWIFGGTGRFYAEADKTTANQNYFFGIKDPFFNPEHESPSGKMPDGFYRNIGAFHSTLTNSDLMDVTGKVIKYQTNITDWADFKDQMLAKDGWTMDMYLAGERSLTKPSVIMDRDSLFAFFLSYKPNVDVCGLGGESYLYGVYGPTGTSHILYNILGASISAGDVVPNRLDGDFFGPPPPTIGIHSGSEVSLLPQFGDGKITRISTGVQIRNQLIYWKSNCFD